MNTVFMWVVYALAFIGLFNLVFVLWLVLKYKVEQRREARREAKRNSAWLQNYITNVERRDDI